MRTAVDSLAERVTDLEPDNLRAPAATATPVEPSDDGLELLRIDGTRSLPVQPPGGGSLQAVGWR